MSLRRRWPSMSRICARMGISSLKIENVRLGTVLLLAVLLLCACTSTRPVVKIGLIAPFEGVQRRSGYGALAAMRLAIAEYTDLEVGVTPLAVDTSLSPQGATEAARKVLAHGNVVALIGPLTPHAQLSAGAVHAPDELLWIAPYAVDPAGDFTDFRHSAAWADALVAAVGAQAQRRGAERLRVIVPDDRWPLYTNAELSSISGMPAAQLEPASAFRQAETADALLWLGDAEAGADFLNRLRRSGKQAQFWLAGPTAEALFRERADALENVYWATWTPMAYNISSNASKLSQQDILVYIATRFALDALSGADRAQPVAWAVGVYAFGSDGRTILISE